MSELEFSAGEIPNILKSELTLRWSQLLENASAEDASWYRACLDSPLRAELLKTFACSACVLDYAQRFSAYLPELAKAGLLHGDLAEASLATELKQRLEGCQEADAAASVLRQFRIKYWMRIVWRDVNRLASMEQTTEDLTRLADVCVRLSLDFHHALLADEWGEPHSKAGEPQRMVVIAMGKQVGGGAWRGRVVWGGGWRG